MKPNWILLGSGVAVIAALAIVLGNGFGRDPHEVPFMMTGNRAPAFSVRRVSDGAVFTLEDLKGKPLVLNFWSTWCVPCKDEQPLLEWAAAKFADRAMFMGVVYEDTESNAHAYLEKTPSRWVQTTDPQGKMAVDYGLSGVPETYFIDAKGTIRYKQPGPIDQRTFVAELQRIVGPS